MGKKDSLVRQEMADELFQMMVLGAATRSRMKARGAADLSETEYLTIDLLARNDRMTVGEIQRSIGVLPAQMSRVIRSLEKRETSLIKCTINSKDKRKIDVELTKLGRQSHKNYRDARLEGIFGYFEVLSPKDCREFMRICRLIRGQMENMLES